MHILLIGASGMIGSRILKEAIARGHQVKAAARHPEKVPKQPGVAAIALDASDADAIAKASADVDAVVCATSPRSTGKPIDEATSVGDALIAATRKTGKRLIVVGGFSSLKPADGTDLMGLLPEMYRGEALGARENLWKLEKTDLPWTFFSPAAIIAPGERTGKFRLGGTEPIRDESGASKISAEDFAVALVDELETPEFIGRQMTIGY